MEAPLLVGARINSEDNRLSITRKLSVLTYRSDIGAWKSLILLFDAWTKVAHAIVIGEKINFMKIDDK